MFSRNRIGTFHCNVCVHVMTCLCDCHQKAKNNCFSLCREEDGLGQQAAVNRPQPTQSIISLTEASLGFETFPTTRGGGQRETVSEIRLKPERASLAKLGMRSLSVTWCNKYYDLSQDASED